MDVFLPFNGTVFEWDDGKATANLRKHGIKFEEATEVFFDRRPSGRMRRLGKKREALSLDTA